MNEWDDRARAPAPGSAKREQLLLAVIAAIVLAVVVAGFAI